MTFYAGFDTYAYPGKAVLQYLRQHSNLRWIGFYLVGPSHGEASYVPKRQEILDEGFGIMPIYLGAQVTGPGSHNVTAAQGKIDGVDAARKMAASGFPAGSYCALDLENGPPMGAAQSAYVGAWIDALRAGGFQSSVYCSFYLGAQVAAIRPGIRVWVFHVQRADAHDVNGPNYPAPGPSTSGYKGATSWQRDNEAHIVVDANGRRLAVDLSSSVYADPSAPDHAVASAASIPAPAPVAHDVRWLQRSLNTLGAQIAVDGDVGDETLAALAPIIEAELAKHGGTAA